MQIEVVNRKLICDGNEYEGDDVEVYIYFENKRKGYFYIFISILIYFTIFALIFIYSSPISPYLVNMYFYDLVMSVLIISPNLLFRQLFLRYTFQHAIIKIGKKKKILLQYENRNKTIVDKVCSIATKVRYNVKTQNSII